MKRQLVVVAGPDTGRTFSVEDGQTLVIGRGQTSDTKINDPRMSRVHCRFAINELFQDTVMKMLAKRPEDRFETPAKLLSQLERIGRFNNLHMD